MCWQHGLRASGYHLHYKTDTQPYKTKNFQEISTRITSHFPADHIHVIISISNVLVQNCSLIVISAAFYIVDLLKYP